MNLSGSLWDYVFVFVGGITLSLTPCVYPLMPVTASFIGITAKGSRIKGLLHSFVYVTGLAITYAGLGLAATATGKMFGTISAHPITRIVVGLMVIFFGVSMFDVFELYFPTVKQLSRIKPKGLFSILLLGLVSGFIVSPCVAPALGAILLYLATTRNILYGTTLLLVFAYGMGMTLIVIGTFSTMLLHLPKSGKWMMYVERIAGSVLIGLGVYFIYAAIRRMYS